MTLCDKFKSITKEKWQYYDGINLLGYEDAIARPLEFIETYFEHGNKNEFLFKSLFYDEQEDYSKQEERAIHTVNTFFLGIYLKERIDFLKPHKNSFLGQGDIKDNFLWAWFLCSLYHDAFFDKKEDITVNCHYNHFSKGLLYNPDLIQRYYGKCKTKETAYKNEPKFDHGIVAAEKLFCNYSNMVKTASNNPNFDFKNFQMSFEFCGLKINNSTFHAMCKIAKIIACHNIFVADKKEESKYEKIPELIPGNKKFFRMPNIKNHNTMNSYEKLYFLLALVDTLEPTKRGINLKDIDIDVQDNYDGSYILKIDLFNELGDYEKYQNGIMGFKDRLNFIEKSEDGKEITINFNHNKNC